MKIIKNFAPCGKNSKVIGTAAVDRPVKIDCLRLPVPFIYTGNYMYRCRSAVGSRQTEKFSTRVSRLVKVDCTVSGMLLLSTHNLSL